MLHLGALVSFTIQKYRTIEHIHVKLQDPFTIIAGPNNSGKTSILEALRISIEILSSNAFSNSWGTAISFTEQAFDKAVPNHGLIELYMFINPPTQFTLEFENYSFVIEYRGGRVTVCNCTKGDAEAITGSKASEALQKYVVMLGNPLTNIILAQEPAEGGLHFASSLRRHLANVLNNATSKRAIINIMKSILPSIEDIYSRLTNYGTYDCIIKYQKDGQETFQELHYLGSGVKEVLLFLVAVYNEDGAGFILVDEFLSHAHWKLAKKFTEAFQNVSIPFIKSRKTVIVVTHDPAVLLHTAANHLIYLSPEGPKPIGQSSSVSLIRALGFPLRMQPGNPLLTAVTQRRILLVEGRDDLNLFENYFGDSISVIPCHGRPSERDVLVLLQGLKSMEVDIKQEPFRIAVLCDRDYRIFTESEEEEEKSFRSVLQSFQVKGDIKLFMWNQYEMENHLFGTIENLAKFAVEYNQGLYPSVHKATEYINKIVCDIWQDTNNNLYMMARQYAETYKIDPESATIQLGLALASKTPESKLRFVKGKRLLHALFAIKNASDQNVLPVDFLRQLLGKKYDPSVESKLESIKQFLEKDLVDPKDNPILAVLNNNAAKQ